jgi:hypothetical protein
MMWAWVVMCAVPLLSYAVAFGVERHAQPPRGDARPLPADGVGAGVARWLGGVGGGALVALPLLLAVGAWRLAMAALGLSVLGGTLAWVARGLRLPAQASGRWRAWDAILGAVLPVHALGCWGGYYAMQLARRVGVPSQAIDDGVAVIGSALLMCLPALCLYLDWCRWLDAQRLARPAPTSAPPASSASSLCGATSHQPRRARRAWRAARRLRARHPSEQTG